MTPGRKSRATGAEPVRLTLRLPPNTVRRLGEVARQRGLSVNALLDEAAALVLLEYELRCHGNEARPDASRLG